MSRVSSIFDDADSDGVLNGGEDINASYKYLGAGRIVEEDYEDIEVKLSYLDGSGDITSLDRFGRIAEQVWSDYGTNPGTLDHYTYTYDRAGNRTARDNELNGTLDESYAYDNLDRLASWSLNGVLQKSWADLDGLGNDLATGTYNAANEMTPTQGSSGYDAAGNMIQSPLPLGEGQGEGCLIYDAWNRMVEVNDGQDIIQQNEYDGANRRIQIFSDFTGATPGATQDDYYTGQQIIETHEDSAVKYQNIWSPRYIDSLILRDTLSAGQIVTADRIFYLADANFNVTGLVKYNSGTSDWDVAERYTYTPYGVATFRNAAWADVGSSANNNATLYTGRYLDLLTSLYYYRARYYDATLERFISRDPIGYLAGDANIYRYVVNNPVVNGDPSGLNVVRPPKCAATDACLILAAKATYFQVEYYLRYLEWMNDPNKHDFRGEKCPDNYDPKSVQTHYDQLKYTREQATKCTGLFLMKCIDWDYHLYVPDMPRVPVLPGDPHDIPVPVPPPPVHIPDPIPDSPLLVPEVVVPTTVVVGMETFAWWVAKYGCKKAACDVLLRIMTAPHYGVSRATSGLYALNCI